MSADDDDHVAPAPDRGRMSADGGGGAPAPDPLTVVDAHIAAFNRCDVDAVMAGFDADAEFATADQTVVGARAIRALFADSFASPITAEIALERAVVAGDTVACELTERLEVEGAAHTIEVAAFYTVVAGQFSRVRIYRDLPSG
jgi:hypothetical protein